MLSTFLSEEDHKWLLDFFKVIFFIILLGKEPISAICDRKKEILLIPLIKHHDWVSYNVFLFSKRAVRVKCLACI